MYAELATVVNWGAFVDVNPVCNVSSAGSRVRFGGQLLRGQSSRLGPSPADLARAFHRSWRRLKRCHFPHPSAASLSRSPIRCEELHSVPLFFVSPDQVNFAVPGGVARGLAVIAVYRGQVQMFSGNVQIEAVAPALFSANSDGRGVAAALAVHVKPDGSQSWHYVFTPEAPPGSRTSTPIDMGPDNETVFLVLFGTGIRGRSRLSAVRATVAGFPADVEYAGPQPDFVGLDQVNVRLPRDPAMPRGEVDVVLTVDERPANKVTVNIK